MTTPPPAHIKGPDFGISVRGYDRAQVDAYFGRVVEWLAEAENRAVMAEQAREVLAREVTDLRTTIMMLEERSGMSAPQSMSAFSERMAQLMESALQAAHELRAEAETEAQERRESAIHDAERVVADARDEAEQIVSSARRSQRAMEESIGDLRASRVEALEILQDLQRQIAAIVGVPEPTPHADTGDDRDVEDDVTTVVPAVGGDALDDGDEDVATRADADDVGEPTTTGVLVTPAPTVVQRAVGQATERPAARRRRSA